MTGDVPARDGGIPRRLLLLLVLLALAGLAAELALLEHYEDPWQFAPFAVIAAGIAVGVACLLRPGPGVLRAFRGTMALAIVAGLVGVYLHYAGNVEFELEREAATGIALFWRAIRGATPALAPGALLHAGLLGLAYTWRHPALSEAPAPASSIPQETR